jgi:hypothetical protein
MWLALESGIQEAFAEAQGLGFDKQSLAFGFMFMDPDHIGRDLHAEVVRNRHYRKTPRGARALRAYRNRPDVKRRTNERRRELAALKYNQQRRAARAARQESRS